MIGNVVFAFENLLRGKKPIPMIQSKRICQFTIEPHPLAVKPQTATNFYAERNLQS